MAYRAQDQHGPVASAFSTSVSSNATAFGFSITITISYGAIQSTDGSPSLLNLLLYGLAAASAVGLLEGLVTQGFRERVGTLPPEVAMMGTAMNVGSVAAGAGGAILCGELLDGFPVWPLAGFMAAGVYVLAESAEVLLAEMIQKARGDADADHESDDG
jgi:hypothetical protein